MEARAEPDSDTLYGVASISKMFTASAVGILVDEGKLDWMTPIVSIVPELNTVDKFVTEQLTILDLLHRTGLETSNNWWFGSDGVLMLNKSQTVSSFNALKQISPFRSAYMYSNWHYALIGEIIERLTGITYGDFVQSRIFGPPKMERTKTKETCKIQATLLRHMRRWMTSPCILFLLLQYRMTQSCTAPKRFRPP